jgi:hypothetical protein
VNIAKKLSDSAKRIFNYKSCLYKQYKQDGGDMSWNDFQKYLAENKHLFAIPES